MDACVKFSRVQLCFLLLKKSFVFGLCLSLSLSLPSLPPAPSLSVCLCVALIFVVCLTMMRWLWRWFFTFFFLLCVGRAFVGCVVCVCVCVVKCILFLDSLNLCDQLSLLYFTIQTLKYWTVVSFVLEKIKYKKKTNFQDKTKTRSSNVLEEGTRVRERERERDREEKK